MRYNRDFDNGGMFGILMTDILYLALSLGGFKFDTREFFCLTLGTAGLWIFFYLLDNGKIV